MPGLLALGACDSGSGPVGPDGPGGPGPDIGIITDLPAPANLAGTWVRDDQIDYLGAPALRSTEWRFDGRGTCRRTVTIFTADGLFPLVDESVCGYQADGRAITFLFEHGEVRVRWSLDGRDLLVLDGDRFHRFRG
jgi:hypothetical protein